MKYEGTLSSLSLLLFQRREREEKERERANIVKWEKTHKENKVYKLKSFSKLTFNFKLSTLKP